MAAPTRCSAERPAPPRGTRNPWDLARTPGGRSSGSAAVGCGRVRWPRHAGRRFHPPAVGSAAPGSSPRWARSTAAGGLDYLSQSVTHVIAGSLGCLGDGPRGRQPGGERSGVSWPDRSADPAAIAAARAARAVAARCRRNSAAAEIPRARRGGSRDGGRSRSPWVSTPGSGAGRCGDFRGAQCLGAQPERAMHGRKRGMRRCWSGVGGRRPPTRRWTARRGHRRRRPRRAAPVGLESTGNPIFVVPGSMLGAPVVSLPVLDDGGLPLGL